MNESLIVSIKNFCIKMIVFTGVLFAADFIFPKLFPSFWPILSTGLALAIVGTFADITIVPFLKSFTSLIIGFPGFILILWGVAKLFPDTHVPIYAATLLSFCLGPFEYALHRYVLSHI